jgi:hypothetical protein
MPRSDAEVRGPAVVVARLEQPSLTRDLTLAARADRRPSPAAAAFLQMTLATFENGAPS